MRRPWVFVALAAACSSPAAAPTAPSACPGADALIAMSDYASSGVGWVGLSRQGNATFTADLGNDPALTVSGGRAFFVARLQGAFFELDACGTPISKTLVNDPTRPGSTNPQDIAVAPDGALWLPRYDDPTIAIVRNGKVDQTIDTSVYDPDGNPQATAIRITNVAGVPKAFVVLERLGPGQIPNQSAAMLRIDVASRAVEAAITLAGRNPFQSELYEDSGVFYLAAAGSVDTAGESDAGIERFDPASSTTKLLVSESELGGSAVAVAVSGSCGVAILLGPEHGVNPTSVVTFDATTGAILRANVLGPSADFFGGFAGLAWVGGGRVLLVGDRSPKGAQFAVHAFDRDDACALQPRPDTIFVSQRPVYLRALD